MNVEYKNDKWIFEKEGVYFGCTSQDIMDYLYLVERITGINILDSDMYTDIQIALSRYAKEKARTSRASS